MNMGEDLTTKKHLLAYFHFCFALCPPDCFFLWCVQELARFSGETSPTDCSCGSASCHHPLFIIISPEFSPLRTNSISPLLKSSLIYMLLEVFIKNNNTSKVTRVKRYLKYKHTVSLYSSNIGFHIC